MEAAGRGGEARAGERDAPRSNAAVLRTLGRYRISRLLGEGTMGRVFLAADPELGREVAIKVLRLEAAGGARDAYIARFRNEARAAARFNHPNVVGVYDAGVDPELGPYLVYEYVAGRTLRKRLEEGRLDCDELMPIAKGVAAALDALHAAGIIHRDIKPDNILLAPTGAVKLTDFGIARVPDAALTRDGQFLGTPAYASPEAITRGEYSVAGDVFSLAAVLFEALCGIRPFPGEDAVAVSYAVANETAPPPSKYVPDLPAAVDFIFAKGMARRKHERYESAGEFARALAQAFRPGATASSTGLLPGATTGAGATQRRPQIPQARANGSRPKSAVPVVLVAVIVTALALMVVRKYTGGEAGDGSDATPARSTPARNTAAPRANTTGPNAVGGVGANNAGRNNPTNPRVRQPSRTRDGTHAP